LGLFKKLLEEGVFVNPVLPPAVAKGGQLLRTSLMATHDATILQRALDAFARVRTPEFPRQAMSATMVLHSTQDEQELVSSGTRSN
jgi:hypothetical protein